MADEMIMDETVEEEPVEDDMMEDAEDTSVEITISLEEFPDLIDAQEGDSLEVVSNDGTNLVLTLASPVTEGTEDLMSEGEEELIEQLA
jgi:hypothetical protein